LQMRVSILRLVAFMDSKLWLKIFITKHTPSWLTLM
jgi:hypothetical protein